MRLSSPQRWGGLALNEGFSEVVASWEEGRGRKAVLHLPHLQTVLATLTTENCISFLSLLMLQCCFQCLSLTHCTVKLTWIISRKFIVVFELYAIGCVVCDSFCFRVVCDKLCRLVTACVSLLYVISCVRCDSLCFCAVCDKLCETACISVL